MEPVSRFRKPQDERHKSAGVSSGLVMGISMPKWSFINVRREEDSAARGSAGVGRGGSGLTSGGIRKDVIGACVDAY